MACFVNDFVNGEWVNSEMMNYEWLVFLNVNLHKLKFCEPHPRLLKPHPRLPKAGQVLQRKGARLCNFNVIFENQKVTIKIYRGYSFKNICPKPHPRLSKGEEPDFKAFRLFSINKISHFYVGY